MPSSSIATGQQAVLLTIDTACHGLRGLTGVIAGFADGGAFGDRIHMNRLSITPTASFARWTDV